MAAAVMPLIVLLSVQRAAPGPFITGSLGPAALAASGFFPALAGSSRSKKQLAPPSFAVPRATAVKGRDGRGRQLTKGVITMNMQSIQLADLRPPAHNPRSVIEDTSLDELAASIRGDGLLQNLVVAPSRGKTYRVISGERRFRALRLLCERGDIDETYQVPVEIRGKLSKRDKLRIATVENVQRENLAPVDEAEAFAELARNGVTLDDIAAETGKSVGTVKRRLAIAGLCDEVKQALRENRITLAVAEVMTLGSHDRQRGILEEVTYATERGWTPDIDDIRHDLLDSKPSVAEAIFPVERYTGTFTKDLFASDDQTFFDDTDQFLELQEQAVNEKAEQLQAEGVTVEVTNAYSIPNWQYRDAEDGEDGITIINLSPQGHVDIRENAVPYDLDRDTATATADTPAAPSKPRPAYSTPLCRYMAYHKTLAVQAELLAHPRVCKILAIGRLIGNHDAHEALHAFEELDEPPASYVTVNETAASCITHLPIEGREDAPAWIRLKYLSCDPAALYGTLKEFSDSELDALLALLTALEFGQSHCNALDTDEKSLFNHVARDLDVAMRNHWTPDAAFLSRRTKDQITQIAGEAGALQKGPFARLTKSDLVKLMERHFIQAAEATDPNEDQQRANAWLPEAMQFPAIDPVSIESADAEADSSSEEAD
ncbi:ParB/RepB/Spo0J family partition protein [uncultured Rhodospira sp.]|uniref:ParB/RepB/Spo0J family partition protein n=1 Tax=uncultured Rhodospira sp. TaxID=1936189 RepID=UPI002619FD6C|nr:ParB/RepB/Spo0J family partition protein [uncultured Rhodospira sp.]